MSDDAVIRVFHLFRALRHMPGFSYRPNGMFEYWGVPLVEIPVSVDMRDYAGENDMLSLRTAPQYPESNGDAMRVVRAVDAWMAERQVALGRMERHG